jgi:hypothetical protein
MRRRRRRLWMQKSKTTTVDGQAHLQTDAVKDEYD